MLVGPASSQLLGTVSNPTYTGTNATYTETGATCLLWDNQAARNFEEVRISFLSPFTQPLTPFFLRTQIEAARKAQAAIVTKENPAVVEEDLKALNLAPPPPAAPRHRAPIAPPHLPPGLQAHIQYGGQPIVAPPMNAALALEIARQQQEALAAQARMRVKIEADHRERVLIEAERRKAADQRARVAMVEERRRRQDLDDAKAARRDRLKRKT